MSTPNVTEKLASGNVSASVSGSEHWCVLLRHSRGRWSEVAAFPSKGLADEWKASAPHRRTDSMVMRIVTFKSVLNDQALRLVDASESATKKEKP